MKRILFICMAVCASLPSGAEAARLVLESGQIVEGAAVKKTDKYIKIDQPRKGPSIYFLKTLQRLELTPEEEERLNAEAGGSASFVPASAPAALAAVPPAAIDPVPAAPVPSALGKELPSPPESAAAALSDASAPSPPLRPEPAESLAAAPRAEGGSFKTIKVFYENAITVDAAPYTLQKTLYIDAQNNRLREEETVVPVSGSGMRKELLRLFDSKTWYDLDLVQGKATVEARALVVPRDLFPAATPQRQEEFLGKPCQVYRTGNLTSWVYAGVVLKQQADDSGIVILQAVSVEEDLPMAADLFELPANIKKELWQARRHPAAPDAAEVPQPAAAVAVAPAVAAPQPPVAPVVRRSAPVAAVPAAAVSLPAATRVPAAEAEPRPRPALSSAAAVALPAPVENVFNTQETVAAIDFSRLSGRVNAAKREMVKVSMENIATALDLYRMDAGTYPTSEQGLAALVSRPHQKPRPRAWEGPYLQSVPLDAWGKPYQYFSPGSRNRHYDLFSLGPDGASATEDDVR